MFRKACIGVAGISFDASFWGFKESQYKGRIVQLREVAQKLGLKFTAIPKSFQDYKGAIAAAKKLNDKADLVILDVATYPEGKAAGAFFDTIVPPLMLWSRNETVHKSNIGHNSFCGANFLGGCLALRGQRFRKLYGQPNSKQFKARLKTAARLVSAAKMAAGAKIGLFGEGIVPKFYDIDVAAKDREKLRERWQLSFVPVTTKELLKTARSFRDGNIEKSAESFKGHFTKIEIPAEALEKQLRLFRALKEISKQENFSSVAIRCWPELQGLYGAWPCPSISVLNEIGIPAACEGDPGGALDMLLAKQLNNKPSTLMDIIDWDDKGNTFSIWHCGPTASSWADKKGAKLICHNVDGRTAAGKPAMGLPGIVDMQFAPGKVSVFRTLGAIDDEFAVQGKIIAAPKRKICGSFGLVGEPYIYTSKVDVNFVRQEIFDRMLPHHYTATGGHIFS